jgi:hypothetical protein
MELSAGKQKIWRSWENRQNSESPSCITERASGVDLWTGERYSTEKQRRGVIRRWDALFGSLWGFIYLNYYNES